VAAGLPPDTIIHSRAASSVENASDPGPPLPSGRFHPARLRPIALRRHRDPPRRHSSRRAARSAGCGRCDERGRVSPDGRGERGASPCRRGDAAPRARWPGRRLRQEAGRQHLAIGAIPVAGEGGQGSPSAWGDGVRGGVPGLVHRAVFTPSTRSHRLSAPSASGAGSWIQGTSPAANPGARIWVKL
jgi:hypothetical protein